MHLCCGPGQDVLETNPHLNRVFQKNLLKTSKTEALKFLWSLRREGYDFSLNTHPQSRIHYRLVARIVGARVRVSHSYDCSGWLDGLLVNRQHPQDYQRHTISNNLDLLQFLKCQTQISADRNGSAAQTGGAGVGTGIRPATKSDRTENLGDARRLAHQESDAQALALVTLSGIDSAHQSHRPEVTVLLFGGPGERAEHEQIRTATDPQRTLHVQTDNLRRAAALLQQCDAFLSVDTALMHLAAAMKTRGQVVIETPTLHINNLPHGNSYLLVPNATVAGRQLNTIASTGAGIKGTRDELLRCMAAVSSDAVFQVVARALASA